eukprot:TRINITY_DN10222_c0_g1_i2.p1 TRINITY_DN10222_c0_g1~~TRINITY_DN10222_c0_g1_i2.p1  ORF type:complete len:426 (+),score=92.87 TRINITY_DN10222_c0_g1_i2:34-1278(+)
MSMAMYRDDEDDASDEQLDAAPIAAPIRVYHCEHLQKLGGRISEHYTNIITTERNAAKNPSLPLRRRETATARAAEASFLMEKDLGFAHALDTIMKHISDAAQQTEQLSRRSSTYSNLASNNDVQVVEDKTASSADVDWQSAFRTTARAVWIQAVARLDGGKAFDHEQVFEAAGVPDLEALLQRISVDPIGAIATVHYVNMEPIEAVSAHLSSNASTEPFHQDVMKTIMEALEPRHLAAATAKMAETRRQYTRAVKAMRQKLKPISKLPSFTAKAKIKHKQKFKPDDGDLEEDALDEEAYAAESESLERVVHGDVSKDAEPEDVDEHDDHDQAQVQQSDNGRGNKGSRTNQRKTAAAAEAFVTEASSDREDQEQHSSTSKRGAKESQAKSQTVKKKSKKQLGAAAVRKTRSKKH